VTAIVLDPGDDFREWAADYDAAPDSAHQSDWSEEDAAGEDATPAAATAS
jgi:hypothetical protein